MAFRLGALFDLTGRTALVTGGNSGIGLAMARALGLAGADIMLAARRQEETASAIAELTREGILARGILVDLAAIKDTAILCIEGERDDISGIGQTKAALKVTPNLPEKLKKYHLAPEVGHYGIFNGSRWRTSIAPVVEGWVRSHSMARKLSVVA